MNAQELKTKLLEAVKKYITDENEIEKIEEAIDFAIENYKDIKHYDGSNYVLHALRTGLILTDLHSDSTTIIAGLIHWLVELNDTIDIKKIKELFGNEVAEICNNLQKINRLQLKSEDELSAIYLRKIFVGISNDVREIIIKLAGRLDNLRYVYTKPDEMQRKKCISTESVLIPIAHRLGINYIKSELEDLCLKYLRPNEYNEILDNLNASREELNGYIEEMKENLIHILASENIKFRIKGRVKSVHSLYDKISKGRKWNDIYDILALRIIVEKESDCYLAVGLIHSKYRPIPKRFKDFIAQPKENMYQSIHTSVIGPNGNIFEVQIRTEEMDEIAENGVASHWSYKEHGTKTIQNLMEQKLEIFRESIETSTNDEEVVSEFKKVFIEKMVYVFTPKGDVIELPEGSTPVDYAYKIHSHVGDTMVGAIVNDQIVPIDYVLKNDDIIKIRTSESSHPKKEWLSFVKTSQAKNKIKAYFSKQDREELIARGEELLNKEIRRRKLVIGEILSDAHIKVVLDELKLKDFDELKLAIGSLRYTTKYIVSLLLGEDKQDVSDLILEKMSSTVDKKKDYKNDIIVAGCDNVLVTMANCCTPIRGDEIIGYITKGNGIIVHKKDCVNIKGIESRLIDVSWNTTSETKLSTYLIVHTNNINNNLLEIITKGNQRGISITKLDTIEKANEVDYALTVSVPNLEALNLFINDLDALKFVTKVERVLK